MGLHEIYSHALLTKREIKMASYWPNSFVAFSWTKTKFYALPAPDTSLKENSLKSYFYRSLQLLRFLLMYGLQGFH